MEVMCDKNKEEWPVWQRMIILSIRITIIELLYDLPTPLPRYLPNKYVVLNPTQNEDKSESSTSIRKG